MPKRIWSRVSVFAALPVVQNDSGPLIEAVYGASEAISHEEPMSDVEPVEEAVARSHSVTGSSVSTTASSDTDRPSPLATD